jgi:hypothetical protein
MVGVVYRWASPSSPWLVVADDGRSGGTVGAHRSDVEASDFKNADVVFIRAIEKRESPLDRALAGQ